ncbi:hypothetical protein BC833DRAFT_198890 [Globomyces pollinis-pini]|nr:hypothetical protein BC833DRAFT_198890 [Globomyces pollinis-pini]
MDRSKTILHSQKKNWPLYNVLLSTTICIIVVSLEFLITLNTLSFINNTFGPEQSGSSPIIATYYGIFVFGLFFQLVGAIDAFYHKNTMQVVAVSIFNIFTSIYAFVQIYQVNILRNCSIEFQTIAASNPNNPSAFVTLSEKCFFLLSTASNPPRTITQISVMIGEYLYLFDIIFRIEYGILFLMVIGSIAGLWVSYKVYLSYGWTVFVVHGADISKKRMVERYHLFILLLKINGYFFLCLMVQVIMSAYFSSKSSERIENLKAKLTFLSMLLIFGVLCYFYVGYYAARRSNRKLMMGFISINTINSLFLLLVLIGSLTIYRTIIAATFIWLMSFVIIQLLTNMMTTVVGTWLLQDFKNGSGLLVDSFTAKTRNQMEVPHERFELD